MKVRMNDRYLFKAKRVDSGEWTMGSLITGVFFRLGQSIPYILCPDEANYDCFDDFAEENGVFEVDPSTICQCTGLKDKNGKLIWENDVFRENHSDRIGVVKFGEHEGEYGWCIEWISEKAKYYRVDFLYWQKEVTLEVVGNAIDNPELLEVGE